MSRRKQARPIRHLDQESSDDEAKVSKVTSEKKKRARAGGVVLSGEDVLPTSGDEGNEQDEEEDKNTKPANGLLPRRRRSNSTTHHHSRVFHHHNTKFTFSESDEDGEINERCDDARRMQIEARTGKDKRKKIRLDEHGEGRGEGAKENFAGGNRRKDNRASKDEDEDDTHEDANNNGEVQRERLLEDKSEHSPEHQNALKESMTAAIQTIIGTWPTTLPISEQRVPSVTLEALQNTKVAMAQFAANALNAVNSTEKNQSTAIQDLALLQSTLITLQQQQLLQLQLIQQLQDNEDEQPDDKKRKPIKVKKETEDKNPEEDPKKSSLALSPHFASLLNCGNQDPNRPLSPGLPPPHVLMGMDNCTPGAGDRATGADNDDPMMMMSNMLLPPPPVNTLEVLQKRAQEVLDSASQGLLASSLAADDPRKKGVGYDKTREPFFKHRCRYCGKVFGSDSALQIHIRSHTGERPFKCNVCGSRFTTKGNLKVHFQRHAAKFPHIKMNPHPVPEQFDHLHPPLLAAGQTSPPELSPNAHAPFHVPAFLPHHPFHSITGGPPPPPPPPPPPNNRESSMSALLRFDMISKYEGERINTPQDLSKKESEHPDESSNNKPDGVRARAVHETRGVITRFAERDEQQEATDPVQQQAEERGSNQQELVRCMMMMMRDKPNKVTNVSPYLTEHDDGDTETVSNTDEPQNLSNNNINNDKDHDQELQRVVGRETRGGSIGKQPSSISHAHPPDRPHSASTFRSQSQQDLRLLLPSSATSSPTTSSPSYASSQEPSPSKHSPNNQNSDITKDPAIYTNLLPRPGSNDNAWESLIEVTKTSETSKLQQLVDNIEHKLTDPNQCIICHRVLSCKSALQMHYRTHTGERPFKCKICGRAFTTKGNLKTHMGVHRAKPPLRVLHQCPVCHKRFTNSLVLQQHIRLHTGEPTDLTPDQIRAAEVKDHYLLTPSTSSTPSPQTFQPGFPPTTQTPPSSQMYNSPSPYFQSQKEDMDISDDDLSDDDSKSVASSPQQSLPFSTSLAALENQVKTITTLANSQMMMMMTDKQRAPEDLTKKLMFENDSSDSNASWKVKKDSPESPEPQDLEQKAAALDLTGAKQSPPQIPSFPLHPGLNLLPPGTAPPPPPFGFSPLLIPPPPPPPTGSAAAAALSAAMAERARLAESNCFLWTTAGPGAVARGNTTCSICLKTFACHSALEIHYRSHTKERPFKCTVCDRGFSTKGNMKQHMLTHKIRDMPSSSSSSSSAGSNTQNRSALDTTPPPNHNSVESMLIKSSDDDDSRDNNSRSPFSAIQPRNHEDEQDDEQIGKHEHCVSSDDEPSRSSTAPLPQQPKSPQPAPRSPPPQPHSSSNSNDSSLKHVCKVCTKNFSSTSALQIHMRTHTGDRPFVCSVCQKAFTTKGNLKVHMGTHMWTNGASRRGRRMSLDMPLGLAAAVAAAAQSSQPHGFFHHPSFPPPPPPYQLKKDQDSRPLAPLSLYHVQPHPYGPSPNQTSPPSSSPLVFLNGTLQKDCVQAFRRSSPVLHQASSNKSGTNSTSDSIHESLADRNNASSPKQEEDPRQSERKKLEMMIKQENNATQRDKTQFLLDEDEELDRGQTDDDNGES